MRNPSDYIGIYLADHYAASVVARRLLDRMISENREGQITASLRQLRREIQDDAETCRHIIRNLGLSPSPVKNALARAGEALGRLKLNGHVLTYSPLSRLMETEGLCIGITGKRKLWETLELLAQRDARLREFDFRDLQARTDEQLRVATQLHQQAAETVLGGEARDKAA